MSDDATRDLLSDRFDQLTTLVKSVIANQSKTDDRVERLERVLEERLYDTRPIWEALRAEVQELGGRVGAIESEMTSMRLEMTGMRVQFTEMLRQMTEMRVETGNGFRAVDRKIGVLGKTLIDMTADIRELQDKVEKIESQPS
jgi:predicted RNase H-like nuclease (RuvC/YqgF family)